MAIHTEPTSQPREALQASSPKTPHLIVCTSQATGHISPILRIVSRLIKKGYSATFIAGSEFQAQVEAIGAECVPIGVMMTPELIAAREKLPEGIPRLQYDLKNVFIGQTPDRWEVLRKTLVRVRKQRPDDDVVLLTETFFLGHMPLLQGAPLPEGFTKRPGVVNVHAAPYLLDSVDTAPVGPGLLPDYTEEGRARNRAMKEAGAAIFADVVAFEREVNASLGIEIPADQQKLPFETWMTTSDVTLQLSPPSVEYKRCDFHPHVKFIGALPRLPVDEASLNLPGWWQDVTTAASRGKKVVAVTQGTLAIDHHHLIIPTLDALAARDDILTVAVLGVRGGSLPDDYTPPANARVVDYLNYDAVLEYADAFVMNAGYGGFMHGVTNGVPMVLAGATEDKPEVSARGEYAGIAINLRTGAPSSEQVADAVQTVLADPKYKERVVAIRKENEDMDALAAIEQQLAKFAGPWA